MSFNKLQYNREYHRTHREEQNKRGKAYLRRYNRLCKHKVMAHYSEASEPQCARCGIADLDVLCIDHINGGGKQHRKEVGHGILFYRWLVKNDYPLGYQVLCFNCNMKKRISEGV